MAKKIVGFIKLQVPAGKANPSPPIGPALGQRGLNIMEFCKAFNAQTQNVEPGSADPGRDHGVCGQELHVRDENAAGDGVDQEGREDRARLTEAAYRQGRQDHARAGRGDREGEDADLTAADMEAAVRTIAGSARSMGITVEGL